MNEKACNEEIKETMSAYLQRRGLAHVVVQAARDPEPAPPVLSWIWMAAFYALLTLAAIVCVWEYETFGRIVKVLVK